MRQFASGGFRIWNLGKEAKLIYSGFGLFSLCALFVSMLFYEDLVGSHVAGVHNYYAGQINVAVDHAGATGPKLDLPDEAPPKLVVAVSYRKLLEVTHFHLFTVPVFLLITAHLFMLTGLSSTAKSIWIVAAFASSLLHLAAPWLIRYVSTSLSFLYPISGAAMAASLSWMTIYPMVVMWTHPPSRQVAD